MHRTKLVLIGSALILCVAVLSLAAWDDRSGHCTAADIAAEIAARYDWGPALPEDYRPPSVDIWYELTTYAGVATGFSFEAYEGTAPIMEYAWDFDSDGLIDWRSTLHGTSRYVYRSPGTYQATLYAFDAYGRSLPATTKVTVLAGRGTPSYQKAKFEHSYYGLEDKRRRGQNKTLTDPASRYWLLAASGGGNFWTNIHDAYFRLTDSFGVHDTNIVVVVPCGGGCLELYQADSGIIDFTNLDSAFNWLYAHVSSSDDLHIILDCHGGGQNDSSCITYNSGVNAPYSLGCSATNVFTDEDDPDDPDLFCVEHDYRVAWSYNRGYRRTTVGLDEWSGYWTPHMIRRHKSVATFSNMTFDNSSKTSDTDIYIEHFIQYHVGDTNHDGVIDTCQSDCDGDDTLSIDTVAGGYVFDENDWGDYYLDLNHDREYADSTPVWALLFDSGFDGNADVCWPCTSDFLDPVVHGTDDNDDGLFVGIDINGDDDLLDSVGVNESIWGYSMIDDDWAEFLDSLEYRKVTFMTAACFGGGMINDLSRSNVVVATSCTEGTLGSSSFIEHLVQLLSGGYVGTDTCDFNGDGKVTYLEAFNANGDCPGAIGIERLDDNGDGVGHS